MKKFKKILSPRNIRVIKIEDAIFTISEELYQELELAGSERLALDMTAPCQVTRTFAEFFFKRKSS